MENDGIFSDVSQPSLIESRLERIKKEKAKLRRQFTNLDAKTKKKVESLIDNAAFMIVQLEDLSSSIIVNGPVSEYKNGENQFGTKKSPEVEIYNTMIKNHMGIIKQLTDLVPKKNEPKSEDDDEVIKFVNSRD